MKPEDSQGASENSNQQLSNADSSNPAVPLAEIPSSVQNNSVTGKGDQDGGEKNDGTEQTEMDSVPANSITVDCRMLSTTGNNSSDFLWMMS